jgi:tRNA uridine 5-carbamoylmethylation protein Kti12
MAKHLTDKDIADICEILDDWPTDTKLTWDRLIEAIKHDLKFETTRQTLEKKNRIKNALKEVKAIVSGRTLKISTSLPPSLKVAAERLEKQDNKIRRLEEENRQLLEQFHVWLYNAYRFGVTPDQLNTPLPGKDNQ